MGANCSTDLRGCDRAEGEEIVSIDTDGRPQPAFPVHGAEARRNGPDIRETWAEGLEGARYPDDEEEDSMRWAPPNFDSGRVDAKQWDAMMATMDQFITPLEAPAEDPVEQQAREGLGTEAQRDGAFAALREGRPLYSLPVAMRCDKDIVLAAIASEGQYCYDYIGTKELREQDRDVVLALIAADGSLLERCTEDLRSDRLIVRIALRTCSMALEWAPAHLQADKELKAIAAAREREEMTLLKRFEAKACGPVPHCVPARDSWTPSWWNRSS